MSLLIIGSLFGIAVLALIGLGLLIAAERSAATRTDSAVPAASTESAPQEQELSAPVSLSAQPTTSRPVEAARDAQQQMRALAPSTSVPATSVPIASLPVAADGAVPVMKEQFYEFSSQLRLLQEQNREVGRRLDKLVTMTEQIKHLPGQSLPTDEDENEDVTVRMPTVRARQRSINQVS